MRKQRRARGAATIVMIMMIAFMILIPLAILVFEFLRWSVAQQELRSVCDAAALSGAAAIATTSASGLTWAQVQQQSMQAAAITFEQNSIYNVQLINTTLNANSTPLTGTPPAGTAYLNIILENQSGTPVATGDPTAKVMQINAIYGYQPPLLGAFNVGTYPMDAGSQGGLPQLDLILCFDVSGSMDDQTNVSFVKRYYDPTTGYVQYAVATAPTFGPANGDIFDIELPPFTGTALNATAPQNLSFASYGPSPTSNGNVLNWRGPMTVGAPADLRANLGGAASEIGCPPGNFDKSNPTNPNGNGVQQTVGPSDYTDVVVNLDGNKVFGGWTDPISGASFPNIGVLVEAARGNLNSAAAFQGSQCGSTTPNPTVFSGITPSSNYQSVYQAQASTQLNPINAAKQAAINFFSTMQVSANCHFGFITFSDGIGKPTPVWGGQAGTTPDNIDRNYSQGGTSPFPLPLVPLTLTSDNYAASQAAVNTIVATGKTDIADSLQEALTELTSPGPDTRPGARRAIVLFTDGEPNVGTNLNTSVTVAQAQNDCYSFAHKAGIAGIPIFCIGLSQNTAIQASELTTLSTIASKSNGTAIIVNGALNSTQVAQQLDEAFQTIARSLVVLK